MEDTVQLVPPVCRPQGLQAGPLPRRTLLTPTTNSGPGSIPPASWMTVMRVRESGGLSTVTLGKRGRAHRTEFQPCHTWCHRPGMGGGAGQTNPETRSLKETVPRC